MEFSIGDWSHDGHGFQDTFVVASNKSKLELREIYFAACDKLQIRLDGHTDPKLRFPVPCSQYEDGVIPRNIINYLAANGVEVPKFEDVEDEEDPNSPFIPGSKEFLQLVLNLIKWQDATVELKIFEPETFHFCGFDEKKRHIGYFGYGTF